jgi:hypothetical protein
MSERTIGEAARMKRGELAELQAGEIAEALALDDAQAMRAAVAALRRTHMRELTAWLAANR